MQHLEVDVLVCGGGMSGMACASFLAQAGANVLVAEKQGHVGGSSAYSAGMLEAPVWIPDGDPELHKTFLGDYLGAVQWMRDQGVPTSEQFGPIMTIGIGYPIKIPDLYALHAKRIRESGTNSRVLLSTKVARLLQEEEDVAGSRVVGAILEQDSKYIKVSAKVVVLATGGFQGSPALRQAYLGSNADNLFVRSNSGSVGDGLKLAQKAGVETSRGMGTYYGHLMASPLRQEDVDPKDYLPLAQYQSRHCILINEQGRRFADETTGDEVVNQYLAKQDHQRGFILFNDAVRAKYCVAPPFPNAGDLDRLAKARSHGCRVAEASTLDGLLKILEEWGVDPIQTRKTLEDYHRRVVLGDASVVLDYPAGKASAPPTSIYKDNGPLFAMEVQPSITFTYGGIAIDSQGLALTADKTPVPNLLVAGVDAGGFSNVGYAGGLALAFVTGYWAAKEAGRQVGVAVSTLPAANPQGLSSVTSRL